jgi:hypothetical protein
VVSLAGSARTRHRPPVVAATAVALVAAEVTTCVAVPGQVIR